MRTIEFEVPGQPVQKKSPYSRVAKGGKFVVTQAHPENVQYEDRIRSALQMSGQWDFSQPPHDGPVCLCVRAYFDMLKSWSKKKSAIMLGAYHTKKPDLDRIENMVQDALTGIVYRDDCQICLRSPAPFKMYDERPRTYIKIVLMEGPK